MGEKSGGRACHSKFQTKRSVFFEIVRAEVIFFLPVVHVLVVLSGLRSSLYHGYQLLLKIFLLSGF